MENWNGYYTKDDPDDRLKPWDNPIVKEAIDTAKEDQNEKIINANVNESTIQDELFIHNINIV